MKMPKNETSVRHEYALVHECELYGCDYGDNPCFIALSGDEDLSKRHRTINGHPARLLVRTVTYSEWEDVDGKSSHLDPG